MNAFVWITPPEQRATIAREVLSHLPKWFGLPESTAHYVEQSRTLPFLACMEGDRTLGFAALRRTSPHAAELYVMGVLPEHHRQGIGTQLVLKLKEEARSMGCAFLHVKTVQSGHYAEYDQTNLFYQRMGFLELECLPLWDEWNPCQLYIMAL